MFDDIELTIGEVLPSASAESDIAYGTYQTCTDACSCMTACCQRSLRCC